MSTTSVVAVLVCLNKVLLEVSSPDVCGYRGPELMFTEPHHFVSIHIARVNQVNNFLRLEFLVSPLSHSAMA